MTTGLLDDGSVDMEFKKYNQLDKDFHMIAGPDSLISWVELGILLDKKYKAGEWNENFSKHTGRLLVSYGDFDKTRNFGLERVASCLERFKNLGRALKLYDKNRSGHLAISTSAVALPSFGFQVTENSLKK